MKVELIKLKLDIKWSQDIAPPVPSCEACTALSFTNNELVTLKFDAPFIRKAPPKRALLLVKLQLSKRILSLPSLLKYTTPPCSTALFESNVEDKILTSTAFSRKIQAPCEALLLLKWLSIIVNILHNSLQITPPCGE